MPIRCWTLSPDEVKKAKPAAQRLDKLDEIRFDLKADAFVENWKEIIKNGEGAMFGLFEENPVKGKDENLVGALGALLGVMFRNNELYSVVQFWHILPKIRGNGYGTMLLNKYENWATDNEVDHLMASHSLHLDPSHVSDLYEENDYELHEKVYRKGVD